MQSANLNRYLRSMRQKAAIRNIFYAGVLLLTVWVLYSSISPRNYLQSPRPVLPKWDERAEQVKQAFLHAYHGYERLAAPHDEVKPISGGYKDK